MKKVFVCLMTVVLIVMVSCVKENVATLKIINETSCDYKVYDGLNPNGNYIGKMNKFETKEFSIDMGSVENIEGNFFALDKKDCATIGLGYEQYQVNLKSGETTTILVD